MNEKLHQLLAQLRLKGIAGALDQELKRAEKEATPVSEVIHRFLIEEQAYRQNQSLLYRLKGAKIPWDWTLKTFPFDKQPGVSKSQIQQLSGLAFVERKENIVFIGNPGTGKSGLAIGLLRQALLSGYRGRFYHAQDLLRSLLRAVQTSRIPGIVFRLRIVEETCASAGREVDDHIALFSDPLEDLLIELELHRGFLCLWVPNVDMADRCPGMVALDGALCNLPGGVMGRLGFFSRVVTLPTRATVMISFSIIFSLPILLSKRISSFRQRSSAFLCLLC
jgi:hypothetical protein